MDSLFKHGNIQHIWVNNRNKIQVNKAMSTIFRMFSQKKKGKV